MRDAANDAQIDFLVPAKLASRYRARILAVSEDEARLRLPFRPSMFRKGMMPSCAAQLTVVVDDHVACVRGTFVPDDEDGSSLAKFSFASPPSHRDFELLRWRSGPADRPPEVARADALTQSDERPRSRPGVVAELLDARS